MIKLAVRKLFWAYKQEIILVIKIKNIKLMKTLATLLALLLSVDAIHMPLKGSALIQTK